MKKESTTLTSVLDNHNQITIEELEKMIKTSMNAILDNPENSKLLPPILIHGAPGLGKSSIVKQVCDDLGIEFMDIRLAEMQAVDIRGLPSVDKEKGVMKWNPPDFWPRDPNAKGIIFLDELMNCSSDVATAVFEIVLDRKIGDFYKVPPRVMIIGAGNRLEDRSVVKMMPSALANRFLHVELTEDYEAWERWGQTHNVHPSVLGFINYKPQMLFNMKDENLQGGWPSPRSWEKVSRMIDVFGDGSESTLRKIVYGLVGNRAGVEFMEFYKINTNFDSVLEMMTNEKREVVIPKELDRKYALCSAVSYLLWRGKNESDQKSRIDGFFRICNALTSDFASMLMMSAMTGIDKNRGNEYCKIIYKNPHYKEFQAKHGTAIRKRYKIM